VHGLLADLPRKHCWTIAEHAGDANPDGMQHLLGRAVWDHDGVRDDVRAYLTEALGDPEAVLIIDETGDPKKGSQSVGCSASTPAPPAASRTPKSPSTSSTPATPGTP
jgi:SRSO17 transposase